MRTTIPNIKKEESAKLELDVEAFLAAGGKITVCSSDDNQNPAGQHLQSLSPKMNFEKARKNANKARRGSYNPARPSASAVRPRISGRIS